MTETIAQTFGRYAQDYDAARRQLIPCFDDFYGTGLRLIAAERPGPLRVLDLGAGTGLFAGLAMDRLDVAAITLLDTAAPMLDRARERFAGDTRVSFIQADLETADLGSGWDAVISALAIHHLTHAAKRALFTRIRAALVPGGRFVNAEQVAGPTPALDDHYRCVWDQDIRAAGMDDAGVAAAAERMTHDICAPVGDQLDWMRAAGFRDVDCLFKSWRFAVLTGRA